MATNVELSARMDEIEKRTDEHVTGLTARMDELERFVKDRMDTIPGPNVDDDTRAALMELAEVKTNLYALNDATVRLDWPDPVTAPLDADDPHHPDNASTTDTDQEDPK